VKVRHAGLERNEPFVGVNCSCRISNDVPICISHSLAIPTVLRSSILNNSDVRVLATVESQRAEFEDKITTGSGHLFPPGQRVDVARAPGRLDVMGGVSDYSGGTVLEKTLAQATFAAVLETADRTICFHSKSRDCEAMRSPVELPHELIYTSAG